MEAKQAWDEVGDRLGALALKVKVHLEEVAGPQDRESVEQALHDLGDVVEKGFSSLGDVIRDPAVRADFTEAGRMLVDALGTTFTEAKEYLREHLPAQPTADTPPKPPDEAGGS